MKAMSDSEEEDEEDDDRNVEVSDLNWFPNKWKSFKCKYFVQQTGSNRRRWNWQWC